MLPRRQTVDDQPTPRPTAAKKAWVDFANANRLAIERGFNPARPDKSRQPPAKIDGDGLARIGVLVTSDELISIYLYRGKRMEPISHRGWKVPNPFALPELGAI